ncbi:site-specific DNA-methyltransferase [Corynebacterium sp. LK30]|uniref:DNA methyltransferase n=1 Tax=unclassified Corynebacterium TaxID=2624378 RepID=UPI00165211F4|nr:MULTISPECIES: DNA methyltransferase [unclassified Corynebacterium]MBC6806085.1 site-specific DNA-methyltransferase [Corynebacterium sp. LK30]MBC6832340.1 site-specific DNA-methyltransferase [Corynebacterium sp. LK29]
MVDELDKTWRLYNADALHVYKEWETPNVIVSDGAYGVGGFPGDPRTPEKLADWYQPHIQAWSEKSTLATSLWFWNTEVGWANVHPVLIANGWKYEFTNIWNKGIGQVAGNVNSKTIRRFPVVTEVCVYYTREPIVPRIASGVGNVHMKRWLRDEWKRTGLPLRQANEACGVKDAATRKYFDQGWLWYWPPAETMMKLVAYANRNGNAAGRPYYSLDGKHPVTAQEWEKTRAPWNYEHGITNVWDRSSLRGKERYRGSMKRSAPRTYRPTKLSATHLNQKPLDLTERIIKASSNENDVVWEPFGGLCTATVAATSLGRKAWAAEIDSGFYDLANERLETLQQSLF